MAPPAAFVEVGSLCDPTKQCWLVGSLPRTDPAPKARTARRDGFPECDGLEEAEELAG